MYQQKSPFPNDYYLKNIEVPSWLRDYHLFAFLSIYIIVLISFILDIYSILLTLMNGSSLFLKTVT